MMTARILTVATLAAALALGACGGKKDVKQGQVVAVVGGKEITVSELNAEMAGMRIPNEKAREQARAAALQALVSRTILTNIARERKLDQSPQYIVQTRRAEEGLLVQTLQQSIAAKVGQPTRQDAQGFISQNPNLFANRKIYQVDQIQFAPPNQEFLQSLQPLKTMAEVEARLIAARVPYKRAPGQIDSLAVEPTLLNRVLALPAGEIFVLPAQGFVVANLITGSEVRPFGGDEAIQYALNALQQRRVNEALERELKAKVEEARKGVRYQPGFEPAKDAAAPKR